MQWGGALLYHPLLQYTTVVRMNKNLKEIMINKNCFYLTHFLIIILLYS